MTRTEILEELQKLPMGERLAVAETALRLIREELRKADAPLERAQKAEQLVAAAEALLPNYSGGSELTVFTSLDAEDFRGER
ncbi:MAG: hypothetical protein ACRD88_08535 [Terriglobia bacterium]